MEVAPQGHPGAGRQRPQDDVARTGHPVAGPALRAQAGPKPASGAAGPEGPPLPGPCRLLTALRPQVLRGHRPRALLLRDLHKVVLPLPSSSPGAAIWGNNPAVSDSRRQSPVPRFCGLGSGWGPSMYHVAPFTVHLIPKPQQPTCAPAAGPLRPTDGHAAAQGAHRA